MKVRIRKDMGLGLMALSVIFLCNPVVKFTDILPDCIGFLLLFNGLRFLADMDEHLETAKKRFLILFWVGVAQIFLQIWVNNFMQGKVGENIDPRQLPNTLMLLSFIWLLIYLLVLIPAFRCLFLGLDRMCDRFGYEPVEKRKRKRRTQKTPGARIFFKTAFFVSVIAFLGFLPEMAAIESLAYSRGFSRSSFDWYDFIRMFRILSVLLCIGFSIGWLVSFWRYFSELKKDKQWILRMQEHYRAEVLPKTAMLSMRRFSGAFLILYVGVIFAVHLKMSYYDCLPGFLFAFLSFAGVSTLGDLLPPQKNTYVACGSLAAASLVQTIVNHIYLKSYLPEESLFIDDAFWLYLVVQLLEIVESVFSVVLMAYLLQTLNEIVKRYTGVQYGGEESGALSASATKKLHDSFRVRLYVIYGLFFVAAIGNIIDVVLHFTFGWLWLIPLGFSVLGVFFYQSLQRDLIEEIGFRYQSEEAYPKK